ncbi:ribosome biogenesis factor YjgA [Methylobacter psychrophilus]|jgi:ribosome-associated protein|uniref:ribosome biogenesis factor YjgA n=1 Tax=Methylobacter psychrophilus TaxID=96941 RepID=UPI0021D4FBFD|nr:ribosome biogenesis factor YjgA [Methylobacter psychrophilus]
MREEQELEQEYEYEYNSKGEIVYYAIRPNKTQIKKELAVLFALSEELSELSAAQVKYLELPDNIHKGVMEVSGMPHKGARKRLLKFITGQLNKIDIDPILEKLARMKNQSAHAVREHHIVERWRDRLIAGGNNALTEFLNEQPDADRQQLRQLLRNIQKETQAGTPPKSSRLLYRYLKDVFKIEGELEPEDYAAFEESAEFEDNAVIEHDIEFDDDAGFDDEDDLENG